MKKKMKIDENDVFAEKEKHLDRQIDRYLRMQIDELEENER